MKTEPNKNSRVPPGATASREDEPAVPGVEPNVPEGQERMCPCCKAVSPRETWIGPLRRCEFCAFNCDGEPSCVKNKCKCPGDCCAEHKAGTKCNDNALLIIAKIGEAVLEVCTACAIEIAKKTLLP